MWKTIAPGIFMFLAAMILVACNSEDGFFGPEGPGGSTGTGSVATVELLASSPQVGSSGSSAVTITAIVKDGNNNLVADVPVLFSASSGALSLPPAGVGSSLPVTDASGQVSAQLSAGGDFTNRVISVTATAGGVSQALDIAVAGTGITISGESSATIGDDTQLTITLTDSGNNPIANRTVTVTSSLGNPLGAASLTTNVAGQVQVTVTAATDGTDVITASSQGASASRNLVISGDQFQLTSPAANASLVIGVCSAIQVSWQQSGAPMAGESVSFSTTRGNLYSDDACTVAATAAMTSGAGTATMYIRSTNAGPATLTAFAPGGPSTSRSTNFIATVPANISLQATPSTIGPNDGSQPTQQNSTIMAIVRDANNNLVAGKAVRFSIVEDISGGSLTTATALTDDLGRASTTYVSSAATTAKDGVVIRGEVDENTAINDTVSLTVARSPLFVRLGTGNQIQLVGQTQYDKKYTVIVTDASGNAAPNASVNVSVSAVSYTKGSYIFDGTSWVQTSFDAGLNQIAGSPQASVSACTSEDLNDNGILDPFEDVNQDGQLTPGNVVAVPSSVTTGADGTFEFSVIYPRQYANWVRVRLTASSSVAGTESSDSVVFWLPIAAADVQNQAVPPPGMPSPFGMVTGDCSTTD